MEIPFARAFIELLASDDITSYLLNFSQQDIKHVEESEMTKSKTSDKLEKFLAGGDIILNCFIPGEKVGDIFDVTISNANNNQVSSLVNAIRNQCLDRFQDIDSIRLVLYKVGFMSDSVVIHYLSNNELLRSRWCNKNGTIFSRFPTRP
ncbi:hypothetical protein RirG_243880 [Rhizophagus irregularis DAOM 197198w]|uniref:Crinkler effector protein N-terminal domain-containing protein n=3 Tax=Rhizophagus irregularis TaxID=588596 RepID=A0A015JEP6_RHIIW|nr:hypothetical protein RirG_243880 [Rhizophagus irregularis DAOM 197198w]